MLRQAFLSLSRQRQLRHWFETSKLAHRLTARFIAGRELEDVLRVSRDLHGQGILSTLDHLGENVTSVEEASVSREFLERTLAAIAANELPATISIKLTQLGLDIGEKLCLENTSTLAACAAKISSRVEVDMESHEYVDRTLSVVSELHATHHCMRSVLQAYLHRTHEDARNMCRLGIPIRLCKGAYDEPASVAFRLKSKVDEEYIKLSRLLLDEGAYPAFATHDPRMVEAILQYSSRMKRSPKDFEFQMLYGIRRDLQDMLLSSGYRLRLYVPYGDAWYPYFMRRLAERPANVFFLAKNLIRA
jgi:proline dehydrogenase